MFRAADIAFIFLKYDLEDLLIKTRFNQYLNLGSKFKKLFFKKKHKDPIEARLRYALEELGPVFVKLGQILATRKDLFPIRFTKELEKLRDDVSVSYIDIDSILKDYIDDFEWINYDPIGSGSVAQVYEAKLKTQEQVVIKVLRPGIYNRIKSDLEMFEGLVNLYKMNSNYRANLIKGILQELEYSLMQEINLQNEARNAVSFAEKLQDFPNVVVPKIYAQYTRENVLVMEKMSGVPIDRISVLKDMNLDLSSLAEQGFEILIIQIIRNRFFHADFHPGNVWIDDKGRRVFLDFGIMGELTKEDRDLLVKLLVNLQIKNYEKLVDLQIEAGWADRDIDKEDFLKSVKLIVDNQKHVLSSINDILICSESFGINIPTRFMLLAKTLMTTESISKNLNSGIDFNSVGKSIFNKHFKQYIK